MTAFGYIVDLSGVELNDDGVTWLQAMPLGKYKHPKHGMIDLTPNRIVQFANNIKNKVRDTDLDIDYDHKEKTTEAAGWVQDAEARLGDVDPRKNGLWLAVEFTKDALAKIKDKAYRYFSPEYVDSWTHPKTGVKHTDVLFGGGLTNRPFLKDIQPINANEFSGGYMLEEMRKLLGLPDDADEAAILKGFQDKLEPPTPPEGEGKPEPVKEPVTATETTPADDPVVKAMQDEIDVLKAAVRLSEVTNRVKALNGEGAKHGLTPAAVDKIKEIALEVNPKIADKIFEFAAELTEGKGLVELGERGGNSNPDKGDANATKQFNDKVEKIVKDSDGKVSISEATSQASREDPELFNEYRRESYVRENG